ncbi:hypothetical protein SaccyDRAFT_3826 [Saccharomonospora cyanea NA-134]|uniref:Uncharacterized protein n=1 Tax=Saccharomonospora cyanea NA-134 TaxID=882082 RepID=H5XG71_9PSEU|nr:hypothetical protein SaccyDRAFT_3826 [Saccharomonospora cyanea NA-134]
MFHTLKEEVTNHPIPSLPAQVGRSVDENTITKE